MSISLVVLKEDQLREAIEIRLKAFGDVPLAHVLRPQGFTPELLEYMTNKAKKSFGKPNDYHVGAVDPVSGKLIAYARWQNIDAAARAEWNVQEPKSLEGELGFINQEANDIFFGAIDQARRDYMGEKDFWTLHLLATSAEARGRGAGTLLLKWGTDRADADGLECYLDSTVAGKPLYEKHGFDTRGVLELDLNQWGVNHMNRLYTMVRPPV